MTVGLNQILIASAALLAIGAFAVVSRRNLLAALFGAQFMLLAGAIAFVAFGRFSLGGSDEALHETISATVAIVVGGVALAELGLGIATAAMLYRDRASFDLDLDGG